MMLSGTHTTAASHAQQSFCVMNTGGLVNGHAGIGPRTSWWTTIVAQRRQEVLFVISHGTTKVVRLFGVV